MDKTIDTSLIKFLNENGAETCIRYSDISKQFYVSTTAYEKDRIFLRGCSGEHEDTIEKAIESFNKNICGKNIVIDKDEERMLICILKDLSTDESKEYTKKEFDSIIENHIEEHKKYLSSPKGGTSYSKLSNQLSKLITTSSNKTLNIGMEKLEIMSKTPGLQLFFGKILQNLDRSTNIVKSIPTTRRKAKTKKMINKLMELKILRYSRANKAYVVMDGVYSFKEGAK